MPTERIIGIDFGTDTTVMRVKRYCDGVPADPPLSAQAVTFRKGSPMLPTLVCKAGKDIYCGYDVENHRRDAVLHRHFKSRIESADPAERTEARTLTEHFFRYLFVIYQSQRAEGLFGEPTDGERTRISYPGHWSAEAKRFLVETAGKVGFPDVKGVDESEAAVHATVLHGLSASSDRRYFNKDKPTTVLLLDMGAGSTAITVFRCTAGKHTTVKTLATWPKAGSPLFAGHAVEDMLSDYFKDKLPAKKSEHIIKSLGYEAFREWKDATVSPALSRDEAVTEFPRLDSLLDALELEVNYRLTRTAFEEIAVHYLPCLPTLIKQSLHEAKLTGGDIDLVVLSGGHSQWYFVKEMLTDKHSRLGTCGLSQIIAAPARVISFPLPEEVVALGLVYNPLTYDTLAPEKPEPKKPDPQKPKPKKPEPQPEPPPKPPIPHSDFLAHIPAYVDRSLEGDYAIKACGISHTKCIITQYNGAATDVIIPAVIDGKTVVGIDKHAFDSRRQVIKSVVFPLSITEIPASLLKGSPLLETVVLHEKITKIKAHAFGYCPHLTKLDFGLGGRDAVIYFPKNLKSIGKGAFTYLIKGCLSKTLKCNFTEIHVGRETKLKRAFADPRIVYY